MLSKLRKDAILNGQVDSFCLVCEYHLRSDDEVSSHIAKPIHSKNLDAAQYLEKYKDEILKVNSGYFCIYCGSLLSSIGKASLHVKDKQHIRNKAIQQTKRFGNFVVVYDSILIDYEAWSGMMRDYCVVCNVEVADKNLHKSSTSHILKLIQNAVEFGASEEIYREVDNSTFYCVICNDIFATNTLDVHFNENEHLNKLNKCKVAYLQHTADVKKGNPIPSTLKSVLPVKIQEKKITSNSEGLASHCLTDEALDLNHFNNDDKESTLLNSTHIFAKNEVNINFENETAFCKKCFENVDFDYDTIVNHIKEHDTNPNSRNDSCISYECEVEKQNDVKLHAITSSSTELNDKKSNLADSKSKKKTRAKKDVNTDLDSDDPVLFAKANSITYNKNSNIAHCQLCVATVSSSLPSMKEHVAGSVHRVLSSKKVSKKTTVKRPVYSKTLMKDFIEDLYTIRSFSGRERIINDKYCIDHLSFHTITETGRSLRCQLCEVNLTLDQVSSHEETPRHIRAMGDTPFITSLEGAEFIREVRPGVFHCGYCNLIATPWENLQNHLISNEHMLLKQHWARRMVFHINDIRELKLRHIIRRQLFGFPF